MARMLRRVEMAVGTIEVSGLERAQTTLAERVTIWLRDPWLWFVALVTLFAVALSTTDIFVPLNRDEGAFLAVAQRVLQGQVPYRDVFDQKSPAIYYYLATILALTGPLSPIQRVIAARIGVVLVDLLTGLGIFLLGHRWWSREVGLLAAILWFVAVPIFNGDQFFTEPFATAATVWALYAADRWPSVRGAFVGGLLLALGSMFKQTAILTFPAIALVSLASGAPARAWWRPSRQAVLKLGALILGTALPWLLIVAVWAAVGGLGPLIQQVIVANLVHYPADSLHDVLRDVRKSLDFFRVLWLTAGMAMAVGAVRWVVLRRAPSPGALALTVAFVFTLLPFKSHAYNHYFLQLVPLAALLSAVLLVGTLDAARTANRARGRATDASSDASSQARALLAPALLGAIVLIGLNRPLPPVQWRATYPSLKGQMKVADWINAHTPASGQLFVFPAEPEYYYLANRTTTAPYVYVLPINNTSALLNEVSAQILAHYYPVVVWQQSGGQDGNEPYYAGLLSALRTNYHVIASYPDPEIWIFVPNP
jgi:hypothetical protein